MPTGVARVAAETEFDAKLRLIREALSCDDLAAIRLRGSDWFAWLTCGGSSVIDTSSEEGIAEVLVTPSDAVVLADRIDAARLRREEVGPRVPELPVVELSWQQLGARDEAVCRLSASGGRVASDRPRGDELPLPAELAAARRRLTDAELVRYRALGADAARALTTALTQTTPAMSEADVATAVTASLLACQMWPVVVLVGGARRLQIYRHPTPQLDEPIGERTMVVACARREGLVADLTRSVYFRPPSDAERVAHATVARIEAAAFDASTNGATLGYVYGVICAAYAREGFAGAEADHHQGGLAGYRTREEIARPDSGTPIYTGAALAWNPSLPGVKVEDTVVVTDCGVDVLTVDPDWPSVIVEGRRRPDILVLA